MPSPSEKLSMLKRLAARQQPRDSDGRWTSSGAVGKVVNLVKQHPDRVRDLVTGLGGTAGIAIGGQLGGSVGALAGDLVGALVTRHAINTIVSVHTAAEKLHRDEAFASAKRLEKLKQLGAATLSELRESHMQERIGDDLTGDLTGFVVGNVAASAISSVLPGVAALPLKGAPAALTIVPKLVAARRRIREQTRNQ